MLTEEKSLGNDFCVSEGGQSSVASEFVSLLMRCWGDSFSGDVPQKYCPNHLSSFGGMTQGTQLPCYHPYPCSSGATMWEGQLSGLLFSPFLRR